MNYQYRAIAEGNGFYTVAKFYRSSMGVCDVAYFRIFAKTEEEALKIGAEALAS